MSSFFGTNLGNVATETIILDRIQNIFPGGVFNEATVVSIQLNYTLAGGTFTINLLQGTLPNFPTPENTVLTLPNGRIGVVKSTGKGYASGGLTDVISGQIISLSATLQDAFTSLPGQTISLAQAPNSLLGGATW